MIRSMFVCVVPVECIVAEKGFFAILAAIFLVSHQFDFYPNFRRNLKSSAKQIKKRRRNQQLRVELSVILKPVIS